MKNNIIYISFGAILGAFIRWQIDQTFIVNIIGCFLIGFLNSLSISQRFKLFFAVGFCGSLTTFSGWIFDLFKLLENGFYVDFFSNIVLVFLTSFFSVFLGYFLGKKSVT